MKLEVCCDNHESVKIINDFKVSSIELNSALALGGLTPSLELLKLSKKETTIPIYCMVRTRAGDFTYSKDEITIMRQEAEFLINNGCDGLVFGFLNDDNTINEALTKEFIDICKKHSTKAIFHRAFDWVVNPKEAYQKLIEWGIDEVLTSGKKPSAEKGLELLHQLHEISPDHLKVGCGITVNNIQKFVLFKSIHGSFSKVHQHKVVNEIDFGQQIIVSKELLTEVFDIISV